jgi:hypothetical protein
MNAHPEEPPRKIMNTVESDMAKREAVWVNLIASCCTLANPVLVYYLNRRIAGPIGGRNSRLYCY